MTRRLRLIVLLARPAVIVLLAMFTATGLAEAGHGQSKVLLARALVVVCAFLLFSVACNDLADDAIDRVNLPGQRPLAAGALGRTEFAVIGVVAGVVALGSSAALRWQAVVVTAAGLAISAGYSLRPVRLADRGAVAAIVLPACYVGVPYLIGIFAARSFLRPGDLFLLAGLYLGFIGRILLKDFRDVRGDALFGKRTFLVRHGRRWTCAFSACCWTAGTAVILGSVHRPTAALLAAEAGCLGLALLLLRKLADRRAIDVPMGLQDAAHRYIDGEAVPGERRDECLISAIAIIGRGTFVLLCAHLSMTEAGWTGWRYSLVIAALGVLTAGMAASMARNGPITRTMVPFGPTAGSALPASFGPTAGSALAHAQALRPAGRRCGEPRLGQPPVAAASPGPERRRSAASR
jgi:4-hydroxybenzoate polyprenyltransferase